MNEDAVIVLILLAQPRSLMPIHFEKMKRRDAAQLGPCGVKAVPAARVYDNTLNAHWSPGDVVRCSGWTWRRGTLLRLSRLRRGCPQFPALHNSRSGTNRKMHHAPRERSAFGNRRPRTA